MTANARRVSSPAQRKQSVLTRAPPELLLRIGIRGEYPQRESDDLPHREQCESIENRGNWTEGDVAQRPLESCIGDRISRCGVPNRLGRERCTGENENGQQNGKPG